ncbi:MAG: cytochrome c oxidase subunit 4 [Propionicimonas sp.]|uniref:cytochrome c oxidase subunit 4 n=1 Tax=Propionicimonas sp. TaxID=1955623 RepID=UPI002B1F255A|nr:cytochrome c oxidase subunit 4 [Propionicimonas sp.]MEA4945532.1 cytochrome c oxidase subunit 4 [Propionicimonas sp.]MEA5053926.1 cytochrome c oxidase subunit 4 [Propionicimonas sp.]MEA5118425.1 cytochrome c oxidase subunit 4 [Propionicimonas sp.]
MRIEARIFGVIGLFLLVVAPTYWLMSHEIIGTVVLLLGLAFAGMLTVYLVIQARKMDLRAEDRKDAEIIEGVGELGFFPPKSLWPFWCALVVTIIALGPVFGWWLCLLGAAVGIWAVSGWCYEYYKGDYQH